MTRESRFKLLDGEAIIDAEFSVTLTGADTFEITLESQAGGGKGAPVRNSDYSQALSEILRRITPLATSLDDCLLSSLPTRGLSEDERRISPSSPYRYPISLTPSEDFERLRLALTSPQGHLASKAVKGGGNARKRITLSFTCTRPGVELDEILSQLNSVPSEPKRDRKDLASGVTSTYVDAALAEWREIGAANFHHKYKTRPAAKFVIADPDGNEYDAKAVLFAARRLAGFDGENSDFDGDRDTVQKPLMDLGYVVEDITVLEPTDEPVPTQSKEHLERAIGQAKEFAGKTDALVERKERREQRLLRRALGLGGSSHECTLCGRTYPDRLLVAAHIKRRSECSHSERTDIPAIAIIACSLGCDALFEHGYITVNDAGVIISTGKAGTDTHLLERVNSLLGRRIGNHDARSAQYFTWHQRQHLT